MIVKLLLIVFLFIVIFIVTLGGLFLRVARKLSSRQTPAGTRREREPERVLACAVCGVHVPESEGVRAAGRFFCCEAHRAADRGR